MSFLAVSQFVCLETALGPSLVTPQTCAGFAYGGRNNQGVGHEITLNVHDFVLHTWLTDVDADNDEEAFFHITDILFSLAAVFCRV